MSLSVWSRVLFIISRCFLYLGVTSVISFSLVCWHLDVLATTQNKNKSSERFLWHSVMMCGDATLQLSVESSGRFFWGSRLTNRGNVEVTVGSAKAEWVRSNKRNAQSFMHGRWRRCICAESLLGCTGVYHIWQITSSVSVSIVLWSK